MTDPVTGLPVSGPRALPRCDKGIVVGSLATRCAKDHHPGDPEHLANGLAEFPYQRVVWFDTDRRQIITDREDLHMWEDHQ